MAQSAKLLTMNIRNRAQPRASWNKNYSCNARWRGNRLMATAGHFPCWQTRSRGYGWVRCYILVDGEAVQL